MGILLTLHILAFTLWIGGLFFAHLILRPVLNQLLDPPLRLTILGQVLQRFFHWIWISILILWTTGLALIFGYHGGMAEVHWSVHTMLTLSLIMTLLFIYVVFIPFPHLKSMADLPKASQALGTIRKIVVINLSLGIIIILITLLGKWSPL